MPVMVESRHADYIDGLRALAVVSVIIYHLNAAFLPGGFIGVDSFFVISGYVVSASVGQLEAISFRQLVEFFYARRLLRIFPALIVCLLIAGLMLDLLVPFSWLSGTNQQTGLAAFLGYSNIILSQTAGDYFSPRVGFNPFTHTWSLGVEEQFYLLFPLLFLWFLNRRRWFSVALVGVVGIVSLTWAIWMAAMSPVQSFYLVTTRFWELASGVLLFQAVRLSGRVFDSRLVKPRVAANLSWVFFFILLASLVFVQPDSTPFPGGMLPVAGTIGLLICFSGQASTSFLQRIFESAPARYLGKISYSLYLWHWPIFVIFRWTCGLDGGVTYGFALMLTFVFSVVSYYFVETPPRHWLRSKRLPEVAFVGIGLASVGAGYGLMSTLWSLQPALSLSTVVRHAPDWYPDSAVMPLDEVATCRIVHTKTHIGAGADVVEGRSGCAMPVTFPHNLFVIGDSHASAYDVMLKEFVLRTGAILHVYGMGGCSFIGLLNPEPPTCSAFTDAAVADVKQKMVSGDVLFLPSLRTPRIVDEYVFYGEPAAEAEMFAPDTAALRASMVNAAMPLLNDLTAGGLKVVFEGPTPEFGEPLFRCADWFDRDNPICAKGDSINRNFMVHLRAPVMADYALFQQVPGVSVWDPFAILCPPGIRCSAYQNGRPVIFDGDHLSGYANRLLEPDFERFLMQNEAVR